MSREPKHLISSTVDPFPPSISDRRLIEEVKSCESDYCNKNVSLNNPIDHRMVLELLLSKTSASMVHLPRTLPSTSLQNVHKAREKGEKRNPHFRRDRGPWTIESSSVSLRLASRASKPAKAWARVDNCSNATPVHHVNDRDERGSQWRYIEGRRSRSERAYILSSSPVAQDYDPSVVVYLTQLIPLVASGGDVSLGL